MVKRILSRWFNMFRFITKICITVQHVQLRCVPTPWWCAFVLGACLSIIHHAVTATSAKTFPPETWNPRSENYQTFPKINLLHDDCASLCLKVGYSKCQISGKVRHATCWTIVQQKRLWCFGIIVQHPSLRISQKSPRYNHFANKPGANPRQS